MTWRQAHIWSHKLYAAGLRETTVAIHYSPADGRYHSEYKIVLVHPVHGTQDIIDAAVARKYIKAQVAP